MDTSKKNASPKPLTSDQVALIRKILGIKSRKDRSIILKERQHLLHIQNHLLQHQPSFPAQNISLVECTLNKHGLETIWQDQECQTVVLITLVNGHFCFVPRVHDLKSENLGKKVIQILRKSLPCYATSA